MFTPNLEFNISNGERSRWLASFALLVVSCVTVGGGSSDCCRLTGALVTESMLHLYVCLLVSLIVLCSLSIISKAKSIIEWQFTFLCTIAHSQLMIESTSLALANSSLFSFPFIAWLCTISRDSCHCLYANRQLHTLHTKRKENWKSELEVEAEVENTLQRYIRCTRRFLLFLSCDCVCICISSLFSLLSSLLVSSVFPSSLSLSAPGCILLLAMVVRDISICMRVRSHRSSGRIDCCYGLSKRRRPLQCARLFDGCEFTLTELH